MRRYIFTTIFGVSSLLSVWAQNYVPGESYFGENNYIEYIAGNLPIVISAPHGGSLEPNSIPDRSCSGCVYGADLFTEDLARKMQAAFFEEFGCYPHVIINRLHRSKLDANRSLGEAADGNATAELAWMEFHDFIELAQDSVESNFEKGLYLDLHGHGHDIQRLELGYLISRTELMLQDGDLDSDTYIDETSIRSLVANNLENYSFPELLRGEHSLGQYFENGTYPAVPSQTDPQPFQGESYFSGGYNTRRYGSRSGGPIDGIQIECNMDGVRDSHANRLLFANTSATVVRQYLERHYFGEDAFDNSFCNTVSTNDYHEHESLNVQVYPNPVGEELKIEFPPSFNEPFLVTIFAQTGQLLFQQQYPAGNNAVIALEFLPKGISVMKVETESAVFIERVVR